MGRRSVHALGSITGPVTTALVVGACVVACGACALVGQWIGLAVCVMTTLGAFAFVQGMQARAVAREGAWLASLPFAVDGYDGIISKGLPSNGTRVRAHVDFESAVPTVDQVRELIAELRGWSIELPPRDCHLLLDGSVAVLSNLTGGSADMPTTNYDLVQHLHTCILGALLPLHERWPVRSVRFVD